MFNRNMIHFTVIAGIFAGVVRLIGFVPYIISISKGYTKPNRATWLVWSILTIKLAAGYWFVGARDTFWVPAISVILTLTVFTLSLKYGTKGWTSFDRKCLVAAAFGLILWWIYDEPLFAVLTALATDIVGAMPTIKKVWFEPESEDRLSWTLFFLSSVANVFAIERWAFGIAVYPISMLISDGLVAGFVLLRKRKETHIEV